MLALAISFLAICIFIIMILMALVEIISENRAKMSLLPKSAPKPWNHVVHRAVGIFHRIKRN